ncbi:hypothetical protein VTO73DRAFT_8624 [Trametes versicolor]
MAASVPRFDFSLAIAGSTSITGGFSSGRQAVTDGPSLTLSSLTDLWGPQRALPPGHTRFKLSSLLESSVQMSNTTLCPPDVNAEIISQLQRGPTIGVAYIGVAISSALYGVTCIQTFQYYRTPRGRIDTRLLRLMVLVLWILDSTHQALIVHVMYYYLVQNYLNARALLDTVWSIPTEIIVNAFIACIVEMFFIMRIWKLSKNPLITGACTIFAVTHFSQYRARVLALELANKIDMRPPTAMYLVYPIRTFFYPSLVEAETKLKVTGSFGYGVAVIEDICIAASLVWILRQGRSGLRRSDDMIGRLVMLTITTGSLTTMFVIANLIAYLAAPSQLYVLFFNFMLGKLYINSLLTSLNSRTYMRGDNSSTVRLGNSTLPAFTTSLLVAQGAQGQDEEGKDESVV